MSTAWEIVKTLAWFLAFLLLVPVLFLWAVLNLMLLMRVACSGRMQTGPH